VQFHDAVARTREQIGGNEILIKKTPPGIKHSLLSQTIMWDYSEVLELFCIGAISGPQ